MPVDALDHMAEAWNLDANPFPAESIHVPQAPYSPTVFDEETTRIFGQPLGSVSRGHAALANTLRYPLGTKGPGLGRYDGPFLLGLQKKHWRRRPAGLPSSTRQRLPWTLHRRKVIDSPHRFIVTAFP